MNDDKPLRKQDLPFAWQQDLWDTAAPFRQQLDAKRKVAEAKLELEQLKQERATRTSTAAAGAAPLPWRLLGECLGEAYQVADDLRDVACRQEEIGKPAGRDATLGRPNAAALLGMGGALDRLKRLTREAIEVIPTCPGLETIRAEIEAEQGAAIGQRIAEIAREIGYERWSVHARTRSTTSCCTFAQNSGMS